MISTDDIRRLDAHVAGLKRGKKGALILGDAERAALLEQRIVALEQFRRSLMVSDRIEFS